MTVNAGEDTRNARIRTCRTRGNEEPNEQERSGMSVEGAKINKYFTARLPQSVPASLPTSHSGEIDAHPLAYACR